METPLRPQVPRQQSRVPGGFDTDEDLSPIKSNFDHGRLSQRSSENENSLPMTNGRAAEESSMLTASTEAGGIQIPDEASILEEREMHRKLMEEDSTFLPPLSPFTGSGRYDTLTSGASPDSPDVANKPYSDLANPQESPQSPSGIYETPAPGRGQWSQQKTTNGFEDTEHTSSSSDAVSSSPTAKAAVRKPPRKTSISSTEGYKTADDGRRSSNISEREIPEEDPTPRKAESRRSSNSQLLESPTPTKAASARGVSEDAAGDTTNNKASPLPSRKRPTFFSTRLSAQKSSFSTYTTVSTEGASDTILGADYALQTGGAAPFGSSTSSRPRMDNSRTTSMGSILSGITGISDDNQTRTRSRTLEEMHTLSEEDPSTVRYDDSLVPQTPRVISTSTEIPTDTVLAKRVNDVEVPATAAREYRNRHRSPSPVKGAGALVNRNGRNLTLKEQSGTIDRLTKENFDLKMKITFLNDSLNKRSPEGVAGLINENADLKASKVTCAKEVRDLKRSIRDLERTLRGKEEELAEAYRRANDEDERGRSGTEMNKEVEEELLFLRDRVVICDVEIEKLRHESFVREGEKRRIADILQTRRSAASDVGAREEIVILPSAAKSPSKLTIRIGHVERPSRSRNGPARTSR